MFTVNNDVLCVNRCDGDSNKPTPFRNVLATINCHQATHTHSCKTSIQIDQLPVQLDKISQRFGLEPSRSGF